MICIFEKLQTYQLDRNLLPWLVFRGNPRPNLGWAKAIRQSLGMTASSFAKRLGMTQAGVAKLEKAEIEDKITLASLRKLAGALDCELHYALVPRAPLEEILQARALEIARGKLASVSHSMALENQAVDPMDSKKQLELLALEILAGPRRNLW